jgi:mRNA interferase RelE/StbE
MYTIQYDEHAIATIKSLDGSIKNALKNALKKAVEEKLLLNPTRFGKPLQHDLAGGRSFRVGDYRVIFDLSDTTIHVWLIAHRKDAYKLAQKRAL